MTVLLATSGDLPQGEPGAGALDAVLRDRRVDFAWARWDDPSVVEFLERLARPAVVKR